MATSREDKHLAIKAAYRALRSIGLDHIRLDGARASDVSPTQESFEHAVLIVRAVAAIHARVARDVEQVRHWVHTENRLVGGGTPAAEFSEHQKLEGLVALLEGFPESGS